MFLNILVTRFSCDFKRLVLIIIIRFKLGNAMLLKDGPIYNARLIENL